MEKHRMWIVSVYVCRLRIERATAKISDEHRTPVAHDVFHPSWHVCARTRMISLAFQVHRNWRHRTTAEVIMIWLKARATNTFTNQSTENEAHSDYFTSQKMLAQRTTGEWKKLNFIVDRTGYWVQWRGETARQKERNNKILFNFLLCV